jgi:hypothetical protein
VTTIAPGKHRRPAPEMEAPAGTPFSSAGFVQSPVDVAGPATGDSGTWAPEYDRMPGRRDMAGAAFRAANHRRALTDPDWPPTGAGPWPQWDAPPDHPSAPVPRVRAPLAPGARRAGRGPARSSSPGVPRSLPNSGPPPRPQRMPSGQPNPGAAARQAAEATAREAAEKEAVHLRAVILSLSEQLSQMSAYVTQSLDSPGGLATMPARAGAPTQTPTIAPPGPRTRPDIPAARPTGPAAPARPTPASMPQMRPRQYNAMRIATAATATLLSFAVISAGVEVATFGFKFFVFRTAVGETGPGAPTDQQFLAQQSAAAHHVVAPKGRHVIKSHKVHNK